MKLGVFADVHGNADAARHALELMAPHVDEFLFAGDAFSDHRFSNEVVELLRDFRCHYVLGNHELSLLGPSGRAAREASHVRDANLRFVQAAPTESRISIGSITLLMVHGSPWQPHSAYLQPGHPRFDDVADLDVDLLVLGHTHLPYVADHDTTLVVNPGSVGRPERPEAPATASCAIVDTTTPRAAAVELLEFDLPIVAPGNGRPEPDRPGDLQRRVSAEQR